MKNHNRHVTTSLYAFNDFLWAMFACVLTVVVLLITQVQQIQKETKTDDDKAPGNIAVYIFWPDGIDLDIDTHLRSPDGEHVFFAKLAGRTWNLLRDDLGMAGDTAKHNFENAYSRGIPPGEYVVNVHAYRGVPTMYPVEIEAEVRITADPSKGKSAQKVVTQRVTLYRTGEEATVVRFRIDENTNLVPGSVNHVFKSVMKRK